MMTLFLDQILPKWADISVWFRFFVLLRASAHNFWRIFYSLFEKLIKMLLTFKLSFFLQLNTDEIYIKM